MSVLVKLLTTTHHSWHLIFSTQPFPLPSDPSQRLWFVHDHGALIYLLTYLLTYIIADDLEWPRRSFQQLQTFISLISRQMYTKKLSTKLDCWHCLSLALLWVEHLRVYIPVASRRPGFATGQLTLCVPADGFYRLSLSRCLQTKVYSVNLCRHLPNHSRNARINSPKYALFIALMTQL